MALNPEVYRIAKSKITPETWYPGNKHRSGVCIWTALMDGERALLHQHVIGQATDAYVSLLCELLEIPVSFGSLWSWNDKQTGIKAIHDVLDRAIAAC